MANASKIAKQILYAIGRGFTIFFKALGRSIARSYRNYQNQKRIEEEQRRYYAQIERENYYAGRGYAKGVSAVREQERVRMEEERAVRQANRNFEKMFTLPKVNDNVFFDEDRSKKRKKRSKTYYF